MGIYDGYFDYSRQSTGPMGGSWEPYYTGPANFRGGGSGGSVAMQMMGSMLISAMAGNNMMPAQFLPQQNIFDQMQANRAFQEQQRAVSGAASADRMQSRRVMRGLQTMTGQSWNPSQVAAYERAMDLYEGAAPFFVQMAPDAMDQAYGSTGSAQVLASRLQRAGRNAVDPLTGQLGYSGNTTAALSRKIYEQGFLSKANLREMGGITAGQMGSVFEEMSRRGLLDMGGAKGGGTEDEQLNAMSSRLLMKSKGLAKAVSAMQDLFGDAGHPNAPIKQIFTALDQLTQGALQYMPADKVERQVRQLHSIAKNTGVGLEVALGLSAHAANMADRLNIDRALVPQTVATALAMAGGAQQVGVFAGAGFGGLSPDQARLLQVQLGAQAAASPVSRRMAVLMHMADSGVLDPNSEAGKMAAALKAGKPVDTTKVGSAGAFSTMLRAGGVAADLEANAMSNEFEMQEMIEKYKLGDVARKAQGEDIKRQFGAVGFNALLARDQAAGRGGGAARQAQLQNVAETTVKEMFAANPEAMKTSESRHQFVTQALKAKLGLNDAEARQAATSFLDSIGAASGGFGGKGFLAVWQVHSDAGLAAGERLRDVTAKIEADVQSAWAGFAKAGPAQRMIDAIADAKPTDTFTDFLGKLAGTVDKRLLKETDPRLKKFYELQRRRADLDRQLKSGVWTDKEAAAHAQLMKESKAWAASDEGKSAMRDWGGEASLVGGVFTEAAMTYGPGALSAAGRIGSAVGGGALAGGLKHVADKVTSNKTAKAWGDWWARGRKPAAAGTGGTAASGPMTLSGSLTIVGLEKAVLTAIASSQDPTATPVHGNG